MDFMQLLSRDKWVEKVDSQYNNHSQKRVKYVQRKGAKSGAELFT